MTNEEIDDAVSDDGKTPSNERYERLHRLVVDWTVVGACAFSSGIAHGLLGSFLAAQSTGERILLIAGINIVVFSPALCWLHWRRRK